MTDMMHLDEFCTPYCTECGRNFELLADALVDYSIMGQHSWVTDRNVWENLDLLHERGMIRCDEKIGEE